MKSREEIINNMCMTYRHDYGLEINEADRHLTFMSGMTRSERVVLFNTMAQIYDNDIAPLLNSAIQYEEGTRVPLPVNTEQAKYMILVAEHYLKHNP